LLAAGNDTGYFRTLTETVVKSFQRKNGIVSNGSPSTTGYGAVGPKTRAAIQAACGGMVSTQYVPFGPSGPSISELQARLQHGANRRAQE
jgi:hypothetical protein